MKKDKHQLLLNMTKEEKELFMINADSNFMSLSQYIRWCVHQMIKKNKWYLLQGYNFHNKYQKPLGDTNSDSKFRI